jgi:multidrug efflux pump subunit AcrB
MIPDPVFGGMAIALIFGALSSAIFSLLLVPLLYRSLHAPDRATPV